MIQSTHCERIASDIKFPPTILAKLGLAVVVRLLYDYRL